MRLLYFYGEIEGFDKKQLNPVEINFSREYDFELSERILEGKEEKKYIKISRSKDYIPLNFWSDQGSVYNNTLFVGKNGSGKSTLLQNIMHAIISCGSRTIDANVLVWQEVDNQKGAIICAIVRNYIKNHLIENYPEEDRYSFSYGSCSVSDIKENDKVEIPLAHIKENDMGSVLKWKDNTKLMFFSNAFSQNDFLKLITDHIYMKNGANIYNSMVYNVSTVKELNDIVSNKNNGLDQSNIINLYWNQKHKEEIEFVFDKGVQDKIGAIRKKVENFEIPIPNKLTIKTVSPLYELNALGANDFIKLRNTVLVKGNVGIIGELAVKSARDNSELFKYLMAVQSIFRAANSFVDNDEFIERCKHVNYSEANKITILKALINALENTRTVIDKKQEFEDTVSSIKKLVDFIYDENSSASDDITLFSALCNRLDGFEVSTERLITVSLKCELKADSLKNSTEKQCLIKFLRLYNDTLKYDSRPYLGFDWGLSSGEANMLSMLATLHKYDKNTNWDNVNTLLLFMDEADIGYHPEWQREWFYIFPRMIEALFSDKKNVSIQFIMATHSPLLLGDMPSRCSYFVESNNLGIKLYKYLKSPFGTEIGTFGQNLYTILSNGFFMKNSALGETAIKKSEEIAEAFRLFRRVISMIKMEPAENILDDVKKDIIYEINKKNKEKQTLFENDCVPYKPLAYKVVEDIEIQYGAYLQYVHSLMNLYSGFIKEKLFQEYLDIDWNLLLDDKGNQCELIDAEIERLNKLKNRYRQE